MAAEIEFHCRHVSDRNHGSVFGFNIWDPQPVGFGVFRFDHHIEGLGAAGEFSGLPDDMITGLNGVVYALVGWLGYELWLLARRRRRDVAERVDG